MTSSMAAETRSSGLTGWRSYSGLEDNVFRDSIAYILRSVMAQYGVDQSSVPFLLD